MYVHLVYIGALISAGRLVLNQEIWRIHLVITNSLHVDIGGHDFIPILYLPSVITKSVFRSYFHCERHERPPNSEDNCPGAAQASMLHVHVDYGSRCVKKCVVSTAQPTYIQRVPPALSFCTPPPLPPDSDQCVRWVKCLSFDNEIPTPIAASGREDYEARP